MASWKKADLSLNEFYREFRENVSQPLLKKVGGGSKDEKELHAAFVDVLKSDDLAATLYTAVTSNEAVQRPGYEKFAAVARAVALFMEGRAASKYLSFVMPAVQWAVVTIYRRYFEAQFDALGLEDELEATLGFKLSSESKAVKIAEAHDKEEEAKTTTPPVTGVTPPATSKPVNA